MALPHAQVNRRLLGLALLTALAAPVTLAADSKTGDFDHKIFALEHALIGVGYDIRQVDGLMDGPTLKALKDYQEKHPGLAATGAPDDATLRALGVQTSAAPVSVAARSPAKSEPKAETARAKSPEAPAKSSSAAQKPAPKAEKQPEKKSDQPEGDWWFF